MPLLDIHDRPFENRKPEAPVGRLFVERWSRRAIADRPLSEADRRTLFEAARWAPSCFNDQPWLFVYAVDESDRERFASLLGETNRTWASKAPLLVFLAARRAFARNGKPNAWADFDAGASWMALALQAHAMGLFAHAMAGFDEERSYDVLGIDRATHRVICAIAIGWPGDAEDLPEALRDREAPSDRKPLAEVAVPASRVR